MAAAIAARKTITETAGPKVAMRSWRSGGRLRHQRRQLASRLGAEVVGLLAIDIWPESKRGCQKGSSGRLNFSQYKIDMHDLKIQGKNVKI